MAERRFRAASRSDADTSSGTGSGSSAALPLPGAGVAMDGSRAVHPALHIDLTRPRHDQGAYWGRARHFVETVNPFNIFASSAKLEEAARIVQTYK